jgi:glucuronoarabinoxylan endo-1,4-beta-xylanase
LATQYQQITGFGATLAYVENEVTQYSDQPALFSAMFSDLGLDVLRLRNRFGYTGDDNLTSTKAIVDAATSSLGHRPTIILASWSPPPVLKASGSTACHGDEDTCTMTRSAAGAFDYAGYATYWRNSVDAYSAIGAAPDYVGIQNNPDFVPSAIEPGEGCKFLPTQGYATVSTVGGLRTLAFPGFAQALDAVQARLQDGANPPKIIAPEVSALGLLDQYVNWLGSAHFDAIGHHLYGSAPSAPDVPALRRANELGQSLNRPVFQTEMQADGLGTAVLLHHTLVTEGASAYLHNALVGPQSALVAGFEPLIALGSDRFSVQPPYHALKHYAAHTDPGWVRVGADSDRSELLVSAWQSPAGKQLAIVIVNAGAASLEVELDLDNAMTSSAHVTRTAFDGVERSADLGALPSEHTVQLPGHSVVTIDLTR